MGSSIKVSASTAERLIVCTGHLSALTRRWVTQNLQEMLHGGHTSLQRPLPTFGNTPPLPKTAKKGTVLQGSGCAGLAEPCVCLCQTPAAGTKEGREQFKTFLPFYLPFQSPPFLSSVTLTALGELSVTGQTGGHR